MGNCASQRRSSSKVRQENTPSNNADYTAIASENCPKEINAVTTSSSPASLSLTRRKSLMVPPRLLRTISEPAVAYTVDSDGIFGCLDSRCNSNSGEYFSVKRPESFLNGGYWPSWKHYEGIYPSSIASENLTHVSYAFADIDGDGTVYLADEYVHFEADVDGSNGGIRAWTSKKQWNSRLKVTLAVGGGGNDIAKRFSEVAASKQKLFTFIQSVKDLVTLFELDGVDIDWEYPTTPSEAKHYLSMLSDLRKALGWHRSVTTALPAGRWALEKLDVVEISKTVDFINLMAYDFVGPAFANVTMTGHHAQLYSSERHEASEISTSGSGTVEYLLDRGMPSRKIMLGIPTFGRSFKGASGPYQPFQGPGSGNEATYEVKHLPCSGTVETFDEGAVAVYASGNGEFITYDNKTSVRKKAEYVKSKRLRGLFYWHLAGDRIGDASLVKSGHEVLLGANTIASSSVQSSDTTASMQQ